jgi:ribosomal protein S18 acetylase RimI-like enzyme
LAAPDAISGCVDIRTAHPSDVAAVVPMVSKICALHEQWDPAKYGFLPHPEERYRRWLTQRADDRRSVFLVAQREDRIAAFLIATVEAEIPIYRVKKFGFIHDLWVEEPYRHEGIGRQMVMLAVEKFKALGVSQIRLDTAAVNDPARKLFASCGFRVSTIEMLMEL